VAPSALLEVFSAKRIGDRFEQLVSAERFEEHDSSSGAAPSRSSQLAAKIGPWSDIESIALFDNLNE